MWFKKNHDNSAHNADQEPPHTQGEPSSITAPASAGRPCGAKVDFHSHSVAWGPQEVARIWNYYSSNPAMVTQYFGAIQGAYLVREFTKYFPLKGPALDYGCGPGFLIDHLLSYGVPTLGLDFSDQSIKQVRAKFAGHPNFLGAIHVKQLPSGLDDACVNLTLMMEVVEHLLPEHISSTFNEAYRVLKPGGYLVVSTPDREELEASHTICPECGCIFHRWQHLRSFRAESLSAMLAQYHFRTIFCGPAVLAPLPLALAGRAYLRWEGPLMRTSRLGGWLTKLRQTLIPGGGAHLLYVGRKPLTPLSAARPGSTRDNVNAG